MSANIEEERAQARARASTRPGAKDDQERKSEWAICCPTTLTGIVPAERQWIVRDWFPSATVTILYGDGGVGKTLLLQELLTSAATGLAWCGLAVERCNSLALLCEDDQDELHRRQDAINASYGISHDDLNDMAWISGVGHDNTLAQFDFDGRIVLTQAFHALHEAAKDREVGLIVIDTAADTFGGNENDRRQVRQFIGYALGKLAKDTGAAVVLAAHPSRTGMGSTGDLDGGSTAWSNTARSRLSLTRPKADGDEQADPDARILTRRKSNYASIGDTIKLTWRRGVLEAVEAPYGLAAMVVRQEADAVFLALLARHTASGIRVSQSKHGANWAPKVFASAPDRRGYTARDFDGAMARLIEAGTIKVHDFGRPSRPQPSLVITAEVQEG